MQWMAGEAQTEVLVVPRTQRAKVTVRNLVTQAFAEWHLDVYRYALSIGLQPAGAQETTQEAFLRLFVALDEGERIENRKAWLFRVAHNLALNQRSRESRAGEWTPELAEQLADPAANPEQAFLERERLQRMHSAVERLSEQQRECIRLRAAGFRYREIAAIIGIKTSTVSEFLKRAIEKLRKACHE
jgi:RNA polymerase sigma factor (sigma-70 family)